ncbi:DsrE family protein [Aciditerrimonas ferrireducens]|uniref:DsrE family protein n=1 Tax=Aciditerrimonas ferrireducens TaxID=667306 RepID=UPI002002A96C|nr:DsrE family protein [Aciditerrimonas ferrireducens]MCK4177240.1 DsrE family protein [Aciditerrimonas ferrireducens]
MVDGSRPGVVVHLDEADPARQRLALANVANLLADLGPAAGPVELVVNGPGLDVALQGSPLAGDLAALQGQGVVVAACANTLAARGLERSALLPGVHVVPAGVSELVRRQREGWAYLRP